MTPPRTSPLRRKLLMLATAVAVLGCATLLYRVDPAKGGAYPPCPLHAMTGYYCPGCGSLRAVHRLLHGQLATAFRMNPLLVASLPVLGLLWLFPDWQRKRWVPWLALAIVVGFGSCGTCPVGRSPSWPPVAQPRRENRANSSFSHSSHRPSKRPRLRGRQP